MHIDHSSTTGVNSQKLSSPARSLNSGDGVLLVLGIVVAGLLLWGISLLWMAAGQVHSAAPFLQMVMLPLFLLPFLAAASTLKRWPSFGSGLLIGATLDSGYLLIHAAMSGLLHLF